MVFINLSSRPEGVTALPTGGVLMPGQTLDMTLTASLVAPPVTDFVLTVTGDASGQMQSTQLLITVTTPFPPVSPPTRSTFIRTDETPTDAVYDSQRKLVFATVTDLNLVEVLSVPDGLRVAGIAVPRAFGIDIAPDGSRVLVGTRTNFIYEIDPDTLQVAERIFFPGIGAPGSSVDRPEEVVATSNGTVLVRARAGNTTGTRLVQWNRTTGIFTDRTPPALGLSAELMARSADYSKVIATTTHSNGGALALYDAKTDSFIATGEVTGSGLAAVAANTDGTQFAVQAGGIHVLDTQLQTANFISQNAQGLIYSQDGSFLYAAQVPGSNASVITAIDAQTFEIVGLLPAMFTSGSPMVTQPFAIDETGLIFGANHKGIAFVDTTAPRSLSLPGIIPRLPNALEPPQGRADSTTNTTFNGVGFRDNASLFLGAAPASGMALQGTNVSVQDTNVIQFTAPSSPVTGPVNVTAQFSNGWTALAPDGFTYGPHILQVVPSGGPIQGGTVVTIFGYGFGFSSGQINVTVGGNAATVVDVVAAPGISPFPFPMHRLRIQTPAGVPGLADLTISTPAGSAIRIGGFNYLQRAQVFPIAGGVSQIVYDQSRQRLYLSNFSTNQVEVFSLATETLLAPIPVGSQPQGLALTPDGALLVVGNFGDNTVTVVEPDNPVNKFTLPASDPDPACDPRPVRVVTTSAGTAWIQIVCTSNGGSRVRELALGSLSFTSRVFPIGSGGDLILAASGDGSRVILADGFIMDGPVALWRAPTDSFEIKNVSGFHPDAAAAADGHVFAAAFAVFNDALQVQSVPQDIRYLRAAAESLNNVFGEKIHPSGSLLYVPQTNGVDIFDVQRGRLRERIALPEPVDETLDALAIDETGRRLFLATDSGLTLAEFAVLPLSIGAVNPNLGSSAGGTEVFIRGSGFQNGAVVRLANTDLVTTFIDETTLRVVTPSMPAGPAAVTVINPDGEQYTFDAAFRFI